MIDVTDKNTNTIVILFVFEARTGFEPAFTVYIA